MKKIKLFGLLLMASVMFMPLKSIVTTQDTPIVVLAEEETTEDVETIENEVNTEEEKESITDKALNEFVYPIIASLSGLNIAQVTYSIIMFLKNKKLTKNNTECIEKLKKHNDELLDKTCEKLQESQKVVDKISNYATDIIKMAQTILNSLKEQNNLTEEIRKTFIDQANKLFEKLSESIKETKSLQKLKPIMVTLASIEYKIASASKDIVASGIGEEIAQLGEYIKKL